MSEPDFKPLAEALAQLQREFPDATLTEVRLEFARGERHYETPCEKAWQWLSWSVQVGNAHGRGDTFEKAMAALQEELRIEAMLPEQVERVAAVLRGLQGGYHDISTIIMRAQELVLQERRDR